MDASAGADRIAGADDPWLVVIDPQRVFADPASEWAAPGFAAIVPAVRALAARFGDRTIVTRWLPGTGREGSWRSYFDRWPFADRPNEDPLFDLVPELSDLSDRPTVDVPTFGKYGAALTAVTGERPTLLLTGVATDCCVISTALAAADAGATVLVITDACAGSSEENHRAACRVMSLYDPQIRLLSSGSLP